MATPLRAEPRRQPARGTPTSKSATKRKTKSADTGGGPRIARAKSAPPQRRFLPPGVSAFLRARAVEGAGLSLIALGLAVLAALVGYNADDPSWNNATAAGTTNPLGPIGAHAADAALQTVGPMGGLIGLALIGWGQRLGRHQGAGRWLARLAALPVAMALGALALSFLPVTTAWGLPTGLGGMVGMIGADGILAQLDVMGWAVPAGILVVLAAAPALAMAVFCLGVTMPEWAALARLLGRGTRVAAVGAGRGGVRGARFLHRAGRSAGQATVHRLHRWRETSVPDEDPFIAVDHPEDRREPDVGFGLEAVPMVDLGQTVDAGPTAPAPASAVPAAAPRAAPPVAPSPPKRVKEGKRAKAEREPVLPFDGPDGTGENVLPTLSLLGLPGEGDRLPPDPEALAANARMLEGVLEDFGVRGEIVHVRPGPVVTLYELEPAPGTKTSRVIGLADDIARAMSAISVRAAVVPGRTVIGIEIPNQGRETVFLREMLASEAFEASTLTLPLILGKDIGGHPIVADMAKMPHLLVAGTTGSGKSVGVNAMILSLLYRFTPERLRLIMVDPKMLELSVYDGIPHLLTPVVTEPAKAVVALKWAVREMESRYRSMSHLGVRNIANYNARLNAAADSGEILTREVQTGFDEEGRPIVETQELDLDPMPHIVVIIDEFSDLMMVAGKEVEACVLRLAQMARAAGIHLIMATQRPSVDVITGTIKANFPSRISFHVTSKVDSRTILGQQGAEQLLGMGDMLYLSAGGRLTRVHGPFVSDEEVEQVADHWRAVAQPQYVAAVTEEPADAPDIPGMPAGTMGGGGEGEDALYDQAIEVVRRHKKASTSFVQRSLKIGYNRAANLIERMEEDGLIGAPNHVGKREILMGEGVDGI